ncbi:ras guanyl-nucleotide exchange factor [Echria macrotheca]|uniref:Ras guanyl-nucleotide exchange factor n=1 Tax=Echria macrotheca TaxID=438768 RepID=A0AAJ0FBY3_9PEZI|nr:ras guanyl-nucleotide exchange factor [Echria macrotheca]
MAASPAQLRALYRSLLRELPPRPILAKPRPPLHQKLHSSFRDPSLRHISVEQAEEMARYLRAQRTYTMLLERYNPGMGMSEEERVRLSARRVGMDLPVEYGKDDK